MKMDQNTRCVQGIVCDRADFGELRWKSKLDDCVYHRQCKGVKFK